nr:MAG TPA: hypothetical protein [Caudoviricetes sp.]
MYPMTFKVAIISPVFFTLSITELGISSSLSILK